MQFSQSERLISWNMGEKSDREREIENQGKF